MKGFTLIETLVVVLIISLLGAMALPYYQNAVQNARTTEAVMQWGSIKRWGTGQRFSAAQASRYEEQSAKHLHYFTPRFICAEKETDEICWEAQFHLKDTAQSIQFYLATQHNLKELLCVPLNRRGENYCQAFSGQEAGPDAHVDGKEAYLVRQ